MIEMLTGGEVAERPRLSVAAAVSRFVPSGAFVHTKSNGALVIVPRRLSWAKNWTDATEPNGLVTPALITMGAGVKKDELGNGLVSAMIGGRLLVKLPIAVLLLVM